MLGTLQLGLLHQAQLLTKYSAYRAARAGAMAHADRWTMESVADQVVLPKYASSAWGLFGGGLRTRPTSNVFEWSLRYLEVGLTATTGLDIPPTTVLICGPLRGDIDEDHVSFDHPDVATGEGADGWEDYSRTKLRVQVIFFYRMPIPFANRIIAEHATAELVMQALQQGTAARFLHLFPQDGVGGFIGGIIGGIIENLLRARQNSENLAPIRASYSMRMMSDINISNLPQNNECIVGF